MAATDWIKMRDNLATDPRVMGLAFACRVPLAHVIGALYLLWVMADQHSEDGVLPGLSAGALDAQIGIHGFTDALVAIGWLTVDSYAVCVTRFFEHNGKSAKVRALTAKRMSKSRSSGAKCDAGRVTECEQVRHLDREVDLKPLVIASLSVNSARDLNLQNPARCSTLDFPTTTEPPTATPPPGPPAPTDPTDPTDEPTGAAADLADLAGRIATFPRSAPPSPDAAVMVGLLRQFGINTQPFNAGVKSLAVLKPSADQLRQAVEKIRETKGAAFKINPAYLVPVVADIITPPVRPLKPVVDNWWLSDDGITRKAAEVGVNTYSVPSFAALKEKVFARIRESEFQNQRAAK